MEIKNFIKIYDEILPWNVLSNLIRFANNNEFEKTSVGSNAEINFNIRRTHALALFNLTESLTNVHWFNLLKHIFTIYLKKFPQDTKIIDYGYQDISNIEILKYEDTGFYTWHTDHFAKNPRTMSCVLLLNNDYEGGNLCFRNPDGSGEWGVEVKPNRMIIWPSNFLYPHTVKPVTKGTRYSVVAWAL
jgi:Rps23 Pro-64 3,4-dihydroxylase Tpa1-like proline 4-hydroxylase